MATTFRRSLTCLILASATVCTTLLPALAISRSDLMIQHNQDIRKNRNDFKRRVEIHLAYMTATSDKATADKDLQWLNGYKQVSSWSDVEEDLAELMKEKGDTDPDVVRFQGEISALKKKIGLAIKSLELAKLNGPAPVDVYKGKDKQALLALVKKAWAQNYPGEQILAVRFDHPTWHVTRRREWVSGGNYFRNNNNSVLEVQVIVKKDATTATVHPVYLQKDLDNLAAGAKPGRKLMEEGSRDILISNVK